MGKLTHGIMSNGIGWGSLSSISNRMGRVEYEVPPPVVIESEPEPLYHVVRPGIVADILTHSVRKHRLPWYDMLANTAHALCCHKRLMITTGS